MTFATTRLEAFSVGVMAIAITLLVLDLRVPEVRGGSLWSALAKQWPSYSAYAVSALVIGIIWVNHHTVFRPVKVVDRPVLFANLYLLVVVTVIPFTTRLLAAYLLQGYDGKIAAALYGVNMLAMSVGFSVLWLAVTREEASLLHEHVDPVAARAALKRFGLGLVVYSIAIGVAFISAVLALVLHGALAIYYAFDQLNS
jgi:uncharacterized membrane protein